MINRKDKLLFNANLFDWLLLQPLPLQQCIQKYSSLLRSHPSSPKPLFTISSSNPQGPRPHSLLIRNPCCAETQNIKIYISAPTRIRDTFYIMRFRII